MPAEATNSDRTFFEDQRASARVCGIFSYAFLMVAGLARMSGASAWPLFAVLAVLMAILGLSALFGGRRPILALSDAGLRFFAGRVGLGGAGGADPNEIPWEAIESLAFEEREIVGSGRRHFITVLAFGIAPEMDRPDGHKGVLEDLIGRGSASALGEFVTWNPETRKVDLLAKPRAGLARLTAAIVERAPHLSDPSRGRRTGLGGPLLYAGFDRALVLAVIGTAWLVAMGDMEPYVRLAKRLLEWGGSIPLA